MGERQVGDVDVVADACAVRSGVVVPVDVGHIAGDKTSTLVFPVPMDLIKKLSA